MRIRSLAALALVTLFGQTLSAQAAAQQSAAPTLDFSGVMFGSFNMRTDSAAKAATGGKSPNNFTIDRVYLNFRMPVGDKTSIRVTTDIFQNATNAYYGGWVVRLKYGYLQRGLTTKLFGVDGLSATARLGMLHTVVIDHQEGFWPRSLGTVALERNGFFSSSDNGVAGILALPNHHGEAYVTITNGSGYTAAETDRFKDIGVRFTWTPLANGTTMFKSLAVSPWYYKGASASAFFNSGPGQVGAVTDGVQKDRLGVFAGLKERRLTAGVEMAQRLEEIESGANTAGSPRTVADRTSKLTSFFALVRPMEWVNKDKQSRWGVLGRLDSFKLDDSVAPGTRFTVFGAWWDITPKSAITLDIQTLDATGGGATVPTKTVFLHWKTDF